MGRGVGVAVVTCVALAVLFVVPSSASSQEAVASLHGRVIDPSGRGLAGVEVGLQSASLIAPLTSATAGDGDFRFVALPPGQYVVMLSRASLVPVKMTMRLSVGQAAVVRIVMHPRDGDEQAMSVFGERQVFPPSWSTTVSSRHAEFENLPTTGTTRSALAFISDLPSARPDGAVFLLDGMPLRHGWRIGSSASFSGPGAESIQEISVTPGRLPAGYGNLQAGAIETATLRGGNGLAGAFRVALSGADLNGDLIREARRTDGFGRDAEYTLGGALVRDRAWFFASGRNLGQTVLDSTRLTHVPFETETTEQLGLGKLTLATDASHRFEFQWTGVEHREANAGSSGDAPAGDLDALGRRTTSDRALSAGYLGKLGSRLDASLKYTHELGRVSWRTAGAPDAIPIFDLESGAVSGAPIGCAVCDPRAVRHQTVRGTLATLVRSHALTAGYETTRSTLEPETLDGASRFEVHATRASVAGGTAYPVLQSGFSWIAWLPDDDRGIALRNQAVFIADRWMPAPMLSLDLGLRFDRASADRSQDGLRILDERTVSPRVVATFKPGDRLPWVVTAGFGRYVIDPVDRAFENEARSGARVFTYTGPSLNTGTTLVDPAGTAAAAVAWWNSNGGTTRQPAFVTGLPPPTGTTRAPHVDEWSLGTSRLFGEEGHARIDVTRRTYGDLLFAELERQYTDLSLKARYRLGHYADFDAQYTFSRLTGNTESSGSGGRLFTGPGVIYPDSLDTPWRTPVGALSDEARHRLRLVAYSELRAMTHALLSATVMFSRESGRPYGAAGLVRIDGFAPASGIAAPPAALYYFTGRDAFRTDPMSRLDLAVNYRRRFPGTLRGELVTAVHVLNVMNTSRIWHPERFLVVRTGFTDPSLQTFNPFTQSPVEGVHWATDDRSDSAPRTLSRTLRFILGIRF